MKLLNDAAPQTTAPQCSCSGKQPLAALEDALANCMHCGFCLAACPTYRLMGRETHSPRGRVALVKAASEGKLSLVSDLQTPLDLCLGCRACETVCPAGVTYGTILTHARAAIYEQTRPRGLKGWILQQLLRRVLPNGPLLRTLGGFLWIYDKSGLRTLARVSGILKLLPMHLGDFEAALTDLAAPGERLPHGAVYPAVGTRRARVALHTGCVAEALLHRTNRRTVQVLCSAGFEVVIAKGQTCCGALHAHAGALAMANDMARQNIAAFEATGADYYVSTAGGCGAMFREYPDWLASEPEWQRRAVAFAAKTRDASELLVELDALPPLQTRKIRITYQDSCHLGNVMGVKEQPRILLSKIDGATFVELAEAGRCCGSAGSYSLLHFDTSMRILDEKMEHVKETGASVIAAGNPGCLLQLRLGIRRAGLTGKVSAWHTMDVLASACKQLPPLRPLKKRQKRG